MISFYIFAFILIFLSSFHINIKCQQSENSTVIEINKTYNGTLNNDFTWAFYELVIPEGVEKNTKNLVFKVKEPDSSFDGKDDFSDPDIYVSSVIKPS